MYSTGGNMSSRVNRKDILEIKFKTEDSNLAIPETLILNKWLVKWENNQVTARCLLPHKEENTKQIGKFHRITSTTEIDLGTLIDILTFATDLEIDTFYSYRLLGTDNFSSMEKLFQINIIKSAESGDTIGTWPVRIDPTLDKKKANGYMVPFSIWGVVWPWDYLRPQKRLSMDFDPADMYRLPESQLGILPKQHPLRKELEDDLKASVARTIADVRRGNNVNLLLIRNSLKQRSYLGNQSFATWVVRRGTLIGRKRCMQIGKEVCKEHNFTLEEAEQLLASARHT